MKREDIEKKAFDFVDAPCERNCEKCDCKHKNDCIWSHFKDGFIEGSNWRIESVWHDNDEYPDKNRFCLYILKDGSYGCGYYHKSDNTIWYESFENIKKWAYIEDLIPNMED